MLTRRAVAVALIQRTFRPVIRTRRPSRLQRMGTHS